MAAPNIFSLEGKGLKLDTAEDLEAHIAPLRDMQHVDEVRVLGNTLGVGACKLLGEVLATKKTLKVGQSVSVFMFPTSLSSPNVTGLFSFTDLLASLDRQPGRHIYRTSVERNTRSAILPAYLDPKSSKPPNHQPE
jgi:hypothetical protein